MAMKWITRLKTLGLVMIFPVFVSTNCKGTDDNGNDAGRTDDTEVKGDVTLYVTTATRSYDFKKQAADFSNKANMSPTTITLEPDQRYQTMDGFGAAVTGSTCYNLLQMTPENRAKFLKETFSPTEGMGYSYIRISIGCSDFSLSEYTCCDTQGIEHFALTSEENDYVIPVLKEIRAINPTVKILGSPWTCPRWMKVNNLQELRPYISWTSGQLNPACYTDYGTYFVKWIQAFTAQGIPIYAVTPQNEPLNRGNSASLFMGWQEQRDFVKNALTPQLKAAQLDTKVYLFDHNYNYDGMADQNDYPVRIYDARTDDETVAGAAYHNYGGNKEELPDIHNKYPGKELIFTETSIGTWNDGRNLSVRLMDDMQEVALGTINNWCKAVIVWNLMLDTERGPNRDGGCQTCYGAVDIDRADYKTITRNSHYYIIGHLSAVVKPGAVRIGTSGYSASGITCSAFENTDGTYAFVLLNNTGESKRITLSDGVKHFSYDVPAQSVVSCQWKKS
jgi:glucosylceramidase